MTALDGLLENPEYSSLRRFYNSLDCGKVEDTKVVDEYQQYGFIYEEIERVKSILKDNGINVPELKDDDDSGYDPIFVDHPW